MKLFCGGLADFVQTSAVSERGPPELWKKLSVAGDQGSDVVAGVNALQRHYHLCLDYVPDPSHGCHNDIWAAAKSSGLSSFFYLLLLTLNVPSGPWSEDARFKQVAQALETLFRHEDLGMCPLFQDMLPALAKELQVCDTSESVEGDVWRLLGASPAWRRKGRKVVRSRFLGVITTGRDFMQEWHQRSFGYSITCIEMGFMANMKQPKVVVKDDNEATGPTSSKREGPEEHALRLACGNQMQMAVCFLLEEANYMTLKAILCVTCPVEAWHSHQNKELRSTSGALAWVRAQVVDGGLFASLSQIMDAFSAESLEHIGFVMPRPSDTKVGPLNDIVDQESLIAERLGDFALGLTAHRLCRTLWLTVGWTCRCILFDQEDEERAQKAVDEFRHDHMLFCECQENPSRHAGMREVAQRSMFQLVVYEQLVALLQRANWRPDESVRRFVRSSNSRIMGTQLCEDGFNRQKNAPKYANRRGKIETAFGTLIKKHVLGEVHKFNEVCADDALLVRNRVLDARVFEPKSRQASMNFADISSGRARAPWFSPGAEGLPIPFADMLLLRMVKLQGLEDKLPDCSFGSLMHMSHHIVVKQSPDSEGRGWFFPLCMLGSLVLAWPADEHEFVHASSQGQFYTPRRQVNNIMDLCIVCCDPTSWVARSFAWRPPSWQQRWFHKVSRSQWGSWRLVAMPESASTPLLTLAAKCGFWSMTKVALMNIARRTMVSVGQGGDLFDCLCALIREHAPSSEKDLVDALGKRLRYASNATSGGLDALLQTDEQLWVFDKQDHDDLKKELVETEAKRSAAEIFRQKYHELRLKLNFDLATQAGKRKARAAGGHKFAGELPAGEFAQSVARRWAPPEASLWRSNGDSGWCGHYEPYKRTHFSGSLHTHRGALVLQLADLWSKYLEYNALPVTDCPYPELRRIIGEAKDARVEHSGASSSSAGPGR